MNDENLIPMNKRSERERKEIGRMGAEVTNRKKKEKKMMREVVQALMDTDMSEDLIDKLREKLPFLQEGMDFKTAMVMGQLVSAMGGNSKSFELLADMGDKANGQATEEYDNLSVEELRGLLNESKRTDNSKT
jgi:hypothetical protein